MSRNAAGGTLQFLVFRVRSVAVQPGSDRNSVGQAVTAEGSTALFFRRRDFLCVAGAHTAWLLTRPDCCVPLTLRFSLGINSEPVATRGKTGFEMLDGLKALADHVAKGECVLFAGAGVHGEPDPNSSYSCPQDHRPLLGRELAEKLAEKCTFKDRFPKEPSCDLQRVSLCLETTPGLGRRALVDELDKHLRRGKKPSPLLRMLAALPFRIFVTTNYDHLLEAALGEVDKDPQTLVYDPDSNKRTPDMVEDPTPERPLVFKMHGDLDQRDSIVITDEDYIRFVQRMSDKEHFHPVPPTIRFRMQKWPTLFVGYSLRDYNLRLLFRTLRSNVDPSEFPQSFSVDTNPDPLIVMVWQNQRNFVTFVQQDLWTFVPSLYEEVRKEKWVPRQNASSFGAG
jgi:hypothetical protein